MKAIKLDNQKNIFELGIKKFLKKKETIFDFNLVGSGDQKKEKEKYLKSINLLGFKELREAFDSKDKRKLDKVKNKYFKENKKIKNSIERLKKYL